LLHLVAQPARVAGEGERRAVVVPQPHGRAVASTDRLCRLGRELCYGGRSFRGQELTRDIERYLRGLVSLPGSGDRRGRVEGGRSQPRVGLQELTLGVQEVEPVVQERGEDTVPAPCRLQLSAQDRLLQRAEPALHLTTSATGGVWRRHRRRGRQLSS
jgi:hypothetical protein